MLVMTQLPLLPDAPAEARPTPMMAQYIEIKLANRDCLLFYRMGDFYELFFEDAEIASRALGIVLTRRGKHLGEDIRMCGVPIDRADDYLQRLIALGHRVAVCEQLEDPAEARKRGAKAVVRRDVVRLVTPGTITEEQLLDPARANVLCALVRVREPAGTRYGLAAADISTGNFTLRDVTMADLAGALSQVEPREIICAGALAQDLQELLAATGAAMAPTARDTSDPVSAARRVAEFFGVATLDGFGALSAAEITAAAQLLAYIELTQRGARPRLAIPVRFESGRALDIDAATRANLELTRTLAGRRDGSLLGVLDQCATPSGSRLMAERLASPLADVAAISARHDTIAYLLAQDRLRAALVRALRGVPDFARALQRLALGRAGPRDLLAMRAAIEAGAALAGLLADLPGELAELQSLHAALAAAPQALAAELALALEEQLPGKTRDGGFIRRSFDGDLAAALLLRDDSRKVIAGLQARYIEATGLRQLKIKHNHVLGYYVEVPQVLAERMTRPPLSDTFIHRQTMADAMRFSTVELGDLDARIRAAGEEALARELALFEDFAARLVAEAESLSRLAAALATLDVSVTLAEIARRAGHVRPKIDASLAFAISGGRHPVVEAALKLEGSAFVANDCALAGDDGQETRLAIVTGPNMAGKSTFLRQNALIVVMAQMGAFVPARAAHIGVVDRLFSRVGAADDLARGRSTFMVEMVETAAILNQAGPRALVILDEIGRGTATFDGLSIAWASMEHLHDTNGSRALFATHFHELTALAARLPRLVNLTMRVTDFEGDVIFLHEVAPGAADRSYGIQVAKRAGLPAGVVARARALLAEMEAQDRRNVPLFEGTAPPPAPQVSALAKRLRTLDPDQLSPKQALEALYEIKRLSEAEAGQGPSAA
ncbi:MAG: DNA mismatch repair protein MutS [Hyphomicrobiales bacterium]|nr:DNA mismatch repair protein MutS [Hyphomicrobiales bacterium]